MKYIKITNTTQQQKINNPIKKWPEDLINIFPKKTYRWPTDK